MGFLVLLAPHVGALTSEFCIVLYNFRRSSGLLFRACVLTVTESELELWDFTATCSLYHPVSLPRDARDPVIASLC